MTRPKVTWSKDKADAALAPYREAKAKVLPGADDELFFTSLLLHASRIPGMCPDQKIKALYDIIDGVPSGDVVEIGTWWGKSALVLLLLARRYGIGNVLCVDPWSDAELVQGAPSVDEASAALSAEEALDVFKMNLLPYCYNEEDTEPDFNYMRMTSADARIAFRSRYTSTPEFGETVYCHEIALLHIDGNHAYEKVRQDVELWAPLVVPGGWMVIDDYDWRHGDGPRRVADEYLMEREDLCHFVAGGAMFIQIDEEPTDICPDCGSAVHCKPGCPSRLP